MGVKELRLERNWSQEKLAELSGLSLRTVQRIEASNRAGHESIRRLASAFGIDAAALELELAMDKSSNGWRRRPIWVRALFLGSGRIRMDRRQHVLVERVAVTGGLAFLLIGLLSSYGPTAPASPNVSMLVFSSLMFLSAYLMALVERVGDRFSVWSWTDTKSPNS